MKIALDISVLNDKNRTGIGVYTYNLIDQLLKLDKEDEFILFGIANLETFSYLNNIEFKKYPNVKLKIYKLPAKLFSKTFIIWQKLNFPNIERFVGPVDIFHSFNWFTPPQKYGKSVATVFDLTSLLFPEFHHHNTTVLDKTRFNFIKKHTDLVLAISENTKKDFLKYSPKSQVEVIYPGVSEKFSPKPREDLKILQKFNLKPGYILSVATLEPRKNILVLLKAFEKSTLENELVLVGGEGWKSKELIKLASLNPKIKLIGFVSEIDLPAIYRQALFLAYPSLYEGFGMPVLEGVSSGTPVITSNISSLPEVGGKAVLYVNPENEEDIKSKLITLTADENLRRQLRKKGLLQAKKFNWEVSAKKLIKIYHGLI
jgi:glycosyltransferase involved in cell wall biosynthesis